MDRLVPIPGGAESKEGLLTDVTGLFPVLHNTPGNMSDQITVLVDGILNRDRGRHHFGPFR